MCTCITFYSLGTPHLHTTCCGHWPGLWTSRKQIYANQDIFIPTRCQELNVINLQSLKRVSSPSCMLSCNMHGLAYIMTGTYHTALYKSVSSIAGSRGLPPCRHHITDSFIDTHIGSCASWAIIQISRQTQPFHFFRRPFSTWTAPFPIHCSFSCLSFWSCSCLSSCKSAGSVFRLVTYTLSSGKGRRAVALAASSAGLLPQHIT